MKNISGKLLCILLIILFYTLPTFAQDSGKIISKEHYPKKGLRNSFIYYPALHSLIPEKIYASIIYETNTGIHQKSIPTIKVGNGYEFSISLNESIEALILAITDSKNNLVDNNSEKGFSIFFYNKNETISGEAYISAAKMLNSSAQQFFNLDVKKITDQIINFFEQGYKISPNLSKDLAYKYYLYFLYTQKKDSIKPTFLVWAKKMANADKDEIKWQNAILIYSLLGMDNERKSIEAKSISTYPNGALAKAKFFEKFYSTSNLTEESILDSIEKFKARFVNITPEDESNFYTILLGTLLDKMAWEKLPKYEALQTNKAIMASMYNNFAWRYSGGEVDNQGSELEKAKILSSKAVYFTYEQLEKVKGDGELNKVLQGTYNNYSDTYALILYKTGQYDSAFYYQDAVYQQGDQLDPGGLERYAVYAEKVKGKKYTKKVIEDGLLKGVNSPALLKQLKLIYQQLNLPVNEFDSVKRQSQANSQQKINEEIKKRFGSLSAPDFSLKNNDGKKITLSSLKNKVVILDFWATWCLPCRASFPGMQEVVNKYKDDSDVVFLFIDTWEKKTEKKTIEDGMKFITDNKYTFNVLFDVDNKVVESFKVEEIPAKFIIDKKGNMLYMGVETKDLISIIEEEKYAFISK